MDRRLFYSAPNLDIAQECQALARELQLAEDNFSVVSLSSKALQDRQLRPADYLKSLDLPRRSLQGLTLGFAGGAILLTFLELIQPYGLDIPAHYYWAPVMSTACFGLWLGILVGLGETNHHLQPLKHKLAKGGSIVIIDVVKGREREIEQVFRQRIPKAKLEKVTVLGEPLFSKTA